MQQADPSFEEERADPMLGDPDLAVLPLPNANLVSRGWRPCARSFRPGRAWEPTPVALRAPRRRIGCLLPKQPFSSREAAH